MRVSDEVLRLAAGDDYEPHAWDVRAMARELLALRELEAAARAIPVGARTVAEMQLVSRFDAALAELDALGAAHD